MATYLPIEDSGSGGIDSAGSRMNNTGGAKNPAAQIPPPPASVTLSAFANGTWRISWKDQYVRQQWFNPFITDITVKNWVVAFCPKSIAGPSSSDLTWATNVQKAATPIGTVGSTGSGKPLSYFQGDTSLGDGYALVWGISQTYLVGPPSYPILVTVSATTGFTPSANKDDPRFQSCTRSVRQVKLADNANKIYEFNYSDIAFKPPVDLTQYGGMQMFGTGFQHPSTSVPVEMGSMCPWNGTSGNNDYQIVIPAEAEVAATNTLATFTNGTQACVRVSGDSFINSTGNTIAVFNAGTNDFVAVFSTIVSAWINANAITIGVFFPFTTGNYNCRIYNLLNHYLNTVTRAGLHRSDPTASSANFIL